MKRNKKRGRATDAHEQEIFWSTLQEETERQHQDNSASSDNAEATADYKTSQLSAQAQDAIMLALVASSDPALRDLNVAAVQPVRGSSCLEIALYSIDPTADLGWLERKLKRAKGYLRGELAAAIHRKRTPDLSFVVMPSDNADVSRDGHEWEADDDES